jgi:LysR family transcriptional regulator, transcriptional activator of the cysJI operon
MTDFNLKVFLAVAKMNSFTRAAEFLNLSQPAVTHQIKILETMLRTKLFNRSQNKIFLTKTGTILLKHAEGINLLYQNAMKEIQEANNRVAGDVHIGAASLLGKYFLPRVIGEFKKTYSEVNISMLVGNSKEILEYLQKDVIELAIVSEPIRFKNLIAFPLYSDHLTIIVDPDHPWSRKKGISPSDLFTEDFISREVGSGTREVYLKFLEAYLKGKPLKTVMVLGNTEAVKMAVMGKMGFSIVSRLAARSEVELGLLKEVRIRGINMTRDFFVVSKSEENLSVPALRLKEYLKSKKREFDRFNFHKA